MKTIEDIAKLDDEALRVMCAEACGWTKNPHQNGVYKFWTDPSGAQRYFSECPNYSTSLDSVHTAVNARDEKFKAAFMLAMEEILADQLWLSFCELDSRQWAVCFAFCAQPTREARE